jgi:hypothetical protein
MRSPGYLELGGFGADAGQPFRGSCDDRVLICDDREDIDHYDSLIDAIFALERPDSLVAPAPRWGFARLMAPAFGPRTLRLCTAAMLIITATAIVGLVRIRPASTDHLDSTLRPIASVSVATR